MYSTSERSGLDQSPPSPWSAPPRTRRCDRSPSPRWNDATDKACMAHFAPPPRRPSKASTASLPNLRFATINPAQGRRPVAGLTPGIAATTIMVKIAGRGGSVDLAGEGRGAWNALLGRVLGDFTCAPGPLGRLQCSFLVHGLAIQLYAVMYLVVGRVGVASMSARAARRRAVQASLRVSCLHESDRYFDVLGQRRLFARTKFRSYLSSRARIRLDSWRTDELESCLLVLARFHLLHFRSFTYSDPTRSRHFPGPTMTIAKERCRTRREEKVECRR